MKNSRILGFVIVALLIGDAEGILRQRRKAMRTIKKLQTEKSLAEAKAQALVDLFTEAGNSESSEEHEEAWRKFEDYMKFINTVEEGF